MQFSTLTPPLFTEKGPNVTKEEAIAQGLWIATANLWLVTTNNGGSIVYQRRGENRAWAPGKLDAAVGGKVDADETIEAAIVREAHEELNLEITSNELVFVGKNLHVGIADDKFVNTIPHIYLLKFTKKLEELKIDPSEVDSLLEIPLTELLKVHTQVGYVFSCSALVADNSTKTISVSKDSFPENWDNYHLKMAKLAAKFIQGETDLYY